MFPKPRHDTSDQNSQTPCDSELVDRAGSIAPFHLVPCGAGAIFQELNHEHEDSRDEKDGALQDGLISVSSSCRDEVHQVDGVRGYQDKEREADVEHAAYSDLTPAAESIAAEPPPTVHNCASCRMRHPEKASQALVSEHRESVTDLNVVDLVHKMPAQVLVSEVPIREVCGDKPREADVEHAAISDLTPAAKTFAAEPPPT